MPVNWDTFWKTPLILRPDIAEFEEYLKKKEKEKAKRAKKENGWNEPSWKDCSCLLTRETLVNYLFSERGNSGRGRRGSGRKGMIPFSGNGLGYLYFLQELNQFVVPFQKMA